MEPMWLPERVRRDVWCVCSVCVCVHHCTLKHSRHGPAFHIRLTVCALVSAEKDLDIGEACSVCIVHVRIEWIDGVYCLWDIGCSATSGFWDQRSQRTWQVL